MVMAENLSVDHHVYIIAPLFLGFLDCFQESAHKAN